MKKTRNPFAVAISAMLIVTLAIVMSVAVFAYTDRGTFYYGEEDSKTARYTLDGTLNGYKVIGTTSGNYGDSLNVSISSYYYNTATGKTTYRSGGSGGSQGGCTGYTYMPDDATTYVLDSASSTHRASDWAKSGYGYGHVGF